MADLGSPAYSTHSRNRVGAAATKSSSADRYHRSETARNKSWAEIVGTGNRVGAWGLRGPAGAVVAVAGALTFMVGCPAFAIYM